MLERQSERVEIKMVWEHTEEGYGVYRKKNAEDGAAGPEEGQGCGEGRHAGGWCGRGKCIGQVEMEKNDPLW